MVGPLNFNEVCSMKFVGRSYELGRLLKAKITYKNLIFYAFQQGL